MIQSIDRQPLYFGIPVPLFGWLHRPANGLSGRKIVLCPSLGFEGRYLHPTFKELADRLASECGAMVLRFDYAGTADSAGDDESADQVSKWLASIEQAIAFMAALDGGGASVALVGVRAGAVLAAHIARARTDIEAVVLWAPVASCKLFLREQRAASRLAHFTAAKSTSPVLEWGERGFEANGYVYSGQTVSELEKLSLTDPGARIASRLLVVDRHDAALQPALVETWREQGASVDVTVTNDYADMMTSPSDVKIPEPSLARIVEWFGRSGRSAAPAPPVALVREAEVAQGVVERAISFGDRSRKFGILTTPTADQSQTVFLVLNTADGYRVGPHGMYPMVARALARRGFATFRVDIAGVGDSEPPQGSATLHPYDVAALADVDEAVQVLKQRGFTRIAVGGICSAAFLAWHARMRSQEITDLLLINLQLFEWKAGMSLDVSPLNEVYAMAAYKSSIHSGEKWKRLLTGRISYLGLLRTLSTRAWYLLRSRFAALRSAARTGGPESEVSALIARWTKEGTRPWFIFSGDDPGIANLKSTLGASWRQHETRRAIGMAIVDGPDHSFTSRWATRELIGQLEAALVGN